jgi:hypothetical protein
MQLAENLGKTRGEIMMMPTEELALWMGWYKAREAKRKQEKTKSEAKQAMKKKVKKHGRR